MTTPQVTELPRRLEPIGSDTFLTAREDEARPPVPQPPAPARELRPLGVVLPMRPRDPLAARRPAKPRRRSGPPHPGPGSGPAPGGDAA